MSRRRSRVKTGRTIAAAGADRSFLTAGTVWPAVSLSRPHRLSKTAKAL
jgi:hypothetical protein